MDRFSDDRDDFEPAHSGFDPDEAISRYLAQKAQRKSRDAQAEEEPDAELDPQDEGEEPLELEERLDHHPHQPLRPPFPTHRPTFGRKGL
jgi:hypothetical protein